MLIKYKNKGKHDNVNYYKGSFKLTVPVTSVHGKKAFTGHLTKHDAFKVNRDQV